MNRIVWRQYLITGLLVLLVAAAVWYFTVWRNPKAAKGFMAPPGCEIIAVVNTHKLAEDVLLYGFEGFKDSQSSRKMLSNSGVDYLQPFWLFASLTDTMAGAAFKISDRKKLTDFLSGTLSATSADKAKTQWKAGKIRILISEELVYIFMLGSGEPAKEMQPLQLKYQNWLNTGLGDTMMRAVVDAGKFRLGTGSFTLTGDENMMRCMFKGFALPQCSIDSSADVSGCIPQHLLKFIPLHSKALSMIKKQGLDTNGLFADDGLFKFRLGGRRNIEQTIVTYEFDDEFNRVEKRTVRSKSIPNIWLQWNARNNNWIKSEPKDSVRENEQLTRIGKSLFGLPVLISYEENNVSLSTRGKGDGKVIRADVPGLLWVNKNSTQKLASELGYPWPLKEKSAVSKVSMLLSDKDLELTIYTNSTDGRPAWMALFQEVSSVVKKTY